LNHLHNLTFDCVDEVQVARCWKTDLLDSKFMSLNLPKVPHIVVPHADTGEGTLPEMFRIDETRKDRMVRLAKALLELGVADRQVTKLLLHDLDTVEKQLRFLPFRQARKPASLIVTAIMEDFEAPAALWEGGHG
jgi:hypothetical protein